MQQEEFKKIINDALSNYMENLEAIKKEELSRSIPREKLFPAAIKERYDREISLVGKLLGTINNPKNRITGDDWAPEYQKIFSSAFLKYKESIEDELKRYKSTFNQDFEDKNFNDYMRGFDTVVEELKLKINR